MKKIHKGTDEKSLRKYLIYRFIQILLVVAVCESILSVFLSQVLSPFLNKLLMFTSIQLNLSGMNVIREVLQIFFILMLNFLLSLLPEFVSSYLSLQLKQLDPALPLLYQGTTLPAQLRSAWAENLYYLGLALIFFLILLLLLLPYFLAAVYFSRLVRIKVEEPMKKIVASMEESNRIKEETERRRNLLLSDMAHDLKTPITTIAGYARALSENISEDPQEQKKYQQAILSKSLRLDELINLLFEYVKLDSEGFRLKQEELDVAELLRENIALSYTDLEEADIETELEIPEERVMILGDPLQLSRVFTNLISNTIFHNPRGIRLRIELKTESPGYVTICFKDSGTVIESETAKHIFDPFFRGDASRTGGRGSGLGLSIASKVVAMHQGELRLNCGEEKPWTKSFQIVLPQISQKI